MSEKLRLIRGSEVSSFLSDRWAWYYKWVEHMVRRYPDGKLWFGTLFHKFLEFLYITNNISETHDKITEWIYEQNTEGMDQVQYQELIEMFYAISGHYTEYYAKEDSDKDVIAAEINFAIPIYDDERGEGIPFAYTGTIDLLYASNNELGFMDHKTVASVDRYVSNAVLDRQISRYWWALTALCHGYGYLKVNGEWVQIRKTDLYEKLRQFKGPSEFIYNIIRKDVPHPPKEIKKGAELSKDKSQNTTYELYAKALVDKGWATLDDNNIQLTPEGEAYADILEHFKTQGNKFFRRVLIKRNDNECVSAMEDFAKVGYEIMKIREEVANNDFSRIYYNITYDTPNMNSYYPLIQAEILGENVNIVRAALFETEKDWNPEDDFIVVGSATEDGEETAV